MPVYAFAAPILPGKVEEWKAMIKQLAGEKRTEHTASRKRAGISRETVFHQQTPKGDFAVVVIESSGDPSRALSKMLESKDPFDLWFGERIEAIHGASAAQMAKMPPAMQVMDWRG
jgi:hypothetical protein